MNDSRKSLNTEVSSVAEEALAATSHALDDTRRLANNAIDKAGDKMRDLRYGTSDLARKGTDAVSEATAMAQRQLGHYAQATRSYVSEQPVKSALIAAAIGATVAVLVLAMRRNGQD